MSTTICNKVQFCFLHEANFVYPKQVKLYPNKTLRNITASSISWKRDILETDAGPLQSDNVVIKSSEDLELLKQLIGAKIILILDTIPNGKEVIGTKKFPTTYTISENLPETTITFNAKKPL